MILFTEPKTAFDFMLSQRKLISDKERRKKLENLLLHYENLFLTMPAAKKHHHNYEGGLAIHTAQVLHYTLEIYNQVKNHMPDIHQDSVYLVAVLHDLSKTQIYKKNNNPNDSYPFDYNEKFKYEHDIWTIKEANKFGLNLTYDEMMGIMQAHGGWSKINDPTEKLAALIHAADMICSQIIKK